MYPRFNLWIEVDGDVALSAWRVALLEAVAETGSISAAAERMNIGYRQAWAKIRECEECLGLALIETTVGGTGGGGAQLTAAGRDLVTKYRAFSAGLDESIRHRFRDVFGADDGDQLMATLHDGGPNAADVSKERTPESGGRE
ncbi:MAG: LysR family transcriptional regulator [Anaerolineae bacterium]